MTDVPPVPPPSPSAGGYGGFKGYGKGSFGAPPPTGGMPYQEYEYAPAPGSYGAPPPAAHRLSDAPVWARALSCVVDTLAILVAGALGAWLLWRFMYRTSCEQLDGFSGEAVYLNCSGLFGILIWPLMVGVFVLAGYLIYARPVGRGEQSIGLRLGRLRVIDAVTGRPLGVRRSALRLAIRTFVSTLLLGLGFWWALWDPERRTLHDLAATSAVRRSIRVS
jgi:uncharacterized RDD family membrane protein YckC